MSKQETLFNDTKGKKFRMPWTGEHIPDKETNTKPSQTVPDSGMSVTEMLQRTLRGLPINSGSQPIYNGEKLLPDWKKLDLIDRAAVVEKATQLVKEKKEKRDQQLKAIDKLRMEEIQRREALKTGQQDNAVQKPEEGKQA